MSSNFWVYTISKQHWEQMREHFSNGKLYITSYHRYSILKNDIILVYQKDTKQGKNAENGFVGVLCATNDLSFNTQIKIFKDQNMNKHIVSIKIVHIFNFFRKMIDVSPHIKNCKEYKSDSSFVKKHIVGNVNFVKMTNVLGKCLYDVLMGMYNADNSAKLNDDEIDEPPKKVSGILTNKQNNNKSLIKPSSKLSTKQIELQKPYSDDDSAESDRSDESVESDGSSESAESNRSDESVESVESSNSCKSNKSYGSSGSSASGKSMSNSDDDTDSFIGNIPILIIPCKKFKITKNSKEMIEMFKSHYGRCEQCDIYNNNKLEMIHDLDKRKFFFSVLRESGMLDEIEELYCSLGKYIFEIDKKEKLTMAPIKIFLVDDVTHVHYGCIFVLS